MSDNQPDASFPDGDCLSPEMSKALRRAYVVLMTRAKERARAKKVAEQVTQKQQEKSKGAC